METLLGTDGNVGSYGTALTVPFVLGIGFVGRRSSACQGRINFFFTGILLQPAFACAALALFVGFSVGPESGERKRSRASGISVLIYDRSLFGC